MIQRIVKSGVRQASRHTKHTFSKHYYAVGVVSLGFSLRDLLTNNFQYGKKVAFLSVLFIFNTVSTINKALGQDSSGNDKHSVQTEQVDSKNTASIAEIKKYVEESGVIETEEERQGFEKKWEEKLIKHAKKDKYADEIREIYTLGLNDYQTLVLILALLDPDGRTPLGMDAIKRAKDDKTLAMLHKNNLFSIENDKDLGEMRAELEKTEKELEKSKKELEKSKKELEKSKKELEKSEKELEKSEKELEKSEKELEKSEKLKKMSETILKVVSIKKKDEQNKLKKIKR